MAEVSISIQGMHVELLDQDQPLYGMKVKFEQSF